jgi:Putative heavy-metal-binding
VGFFRRNADDEEPEEQGESLARITEGGIPASAEVRLRALSGEGSMFTSGLSVKEFALLDRLGPRPLAQVMGASVIRTGWQYLPALPPGEKFTAWASAQPGSLGRGQQLGPTAYGSALQNPFTEPSLSQVRDYQWHTEVVCELNVLTAAWNTARRRALARLTEEALHVGADVVVSVHVRRSDHDLGSGTIEYVVSGTAIRLPGSSGSPRPTLTDLSVQDYWRLLKAGHKPVGLLASTAVVFASPPRSTRLRRTRSVAQNQELAEISGAFRLARETVRAGLRGQVADMHGAGAVGVEFSHSLHRDKLALASSLQSESRRGWHLGRFGIPYFVSGHSDFKRRGWVITMHASGTAVRPTQGPSNQEKVKTTMRMEGR